MKFSALLLGVVAAGKGGRGGKHGAVDLEGTRYNWKIPKCITSPEFCKLDKVETANSGKIKLTAKDYENHRNVMYRIQLGDSRKIKLKFNQEDGFGMEWHRNCGYDKVHIFTGRADDFDNAQRIARFCGPKKAGGAPFDAAGNVRPINGKMAMWDEWMDVGSGDVIVAIDLDQDRSDFTGFVLEYESEPTGLPDFSNFWEATDFLNDYILSATRQLPWKNIKPVIVATNNLIKLMKKRARPDQYRKCQNDFNSPLATWIQTNLRNLYNDPNHNEPSAWVLAVTNCGRIMGQYLQDCPAGKSWSDESKLKNIYQKYNNNILDGSSVP